MSQDILSFTNYTLKFIPGVLYETEWVTSSKAKTFPWYEKSDTHYILSKLSVFPGCSDFVLQQIDLNKTDKIYMLRWERVAPVVEQIAYMIGKFYTEWPR